MIEGKAKTQNESVSSPENEKNQEGNKSKAKTSFNRSSRNLDNPLNNPELLSKRNVIINTSTSKMMHAFPKAIRFNYNTHDNSSFFYNIPNKMEKRAAFIGYGNKMNMNPSKDGKSDNIYNIPREFDLTKNHGTPRYTMGYGRDVCKKPQWKNEAQLPGPTSYSPYKKFGENGLKYSMSFRYDNKCGYLKTPGPGSYKYAEFNNKGTYSTSVLSNSPLSKFPGAKRFKYNYEKTPGPGAYESENLIKGNGVCNNSIFTSFPGKTMGMRLAKIGEKLVTPGPGSYDHFSDFEGFGKFQFKKMSRSKSMPEVNKK